MRKPCDKDDGESKIKNEVDEKKVKKKKHRNSWKNVLMEIHKNEVDEKKVKKTHRNSWKNVLMEIQCTMPVKL